MHFNAKAVLQTIALPLPLHCVSRIDQERQGGIVTSDSGPAPRLSMTASHQPRTNILICAADD